MHECHIYPKYLGIKVWESVDPDQMPHFAASDQGLHCLLVFRHIKMYKNELVQISGQI